MNDYVPVIAAAALGVTRLSRLAPALERCAPRPEALLARIYHMAGAWAFLRRLMSSSMPVGADDRDEPSEMFRGFLGLRRALDGNVRQSCADALRAVRLRPLLLRTVGDLLAVLRHTGEVGGDPDVLLVQLDDVGASAVDFSALNRLANRLRRAAGP